MIYCYIKRQKLNNAVKKLSTELEISDSPLSNDSIPKETPSTYTRTPGMSKGITRSPVSDNGYSDDDEELYNNNSKGNGMITNGQTLGVQHTDSGESIDIQTPNHVIDQGNV